MTEENKSMDKGRRLLIGFTIVLLLLTAGAYFFGVYYFTGHFLPGSQVNGFNCSYMTEKEAEKLLEKKTGVYTLAVQTRGNGQEGISADEIRLKYTSDGSVKRLLHEQNRFVWFLVFSQHKTYELPSSVSYDENLFEKKINSLKCMKNNIDPEDAYIRECEDGFEVVPEIEGTRVDREKLLADIKEAVTTGRTVANLEEDDCYINPSVYAENLTKDCQQMNDLTDVVITYDFSDRKESVNRAVIKEWLTRNENGDLVLDKTAIAKYIAGLAEKYDTVGTERTFSTYDNQDITVSGGNYGWVINQKKETDVLYQDILDKKTEVREPIYEQTAESRNTNDIGYSYIEIDLTRQRMVLYQNGTPIADTGFAASSSTPTGVYRLGEKQESAIPGNTEANSGKNGVSVSLWMPFTDELGIYGDPELIITGADIAVDTFGSSENMDFSSSYNCWESTEGCIAVPEEEAQIIYQNVNSGLPVIIY
mgnify:FL=1